MLERPVRSARDLQRRPPPRAGVVVSAPSCRVLLFATVGRPTPNRRDAHAIAFRYLAHIRHPIQRWQLNAVGALISIQIRWVPAARVRADLSPPWKLRLHAIYPDATIIEADHGGSM